jgi:ABC-type sugar transport system ATPase subunit
MVPGPPILELRGISKDFAGVHALRDVDLVVSPGRVQAVVGENGAGKSTLMKIVAGALQPDRGEVHFDGRPVTWRSPLDALRVGIATVYQEPPIYPDLSVLENFQLGHEERDRLGGIAWARCRARATAALAAFGFDRALLDRPMRSLSLGRQQLVLIARAAASAPRLLILDEPTSMLSSAETDQLFALVRRLRSGGTAVLYISHRLAEVFRIGDEITVLRDGGLVGSMAVAEGSEDLLVELMSGRHIDRRAYRPPGGEGAVVLDVRGLGRAGAFADVDLELRRGRIVGLYGLVGSGRSEVAQAIFGFQPANRGRIRLEGRTIHPRSAAEGIRLGIAYLGEDRQAQGTFSSRSVADNLTAAILPRLSGGLGWLERREERRLTARAIGDLRIRVPSPALPIDVLSGGSQQKVLFARWLLPTPKVLILDEPTRGIDVGTKGQIHELILEQARDQGRAVLLISSDLAEVLAISDEVRVMREGRLVESLDRAAATEQRVLRAALGLAPRTPMVAQ